METIKLFNSNMTNGLFNPDNNRGKSKGKHKQPWTLPISQKAYQGFVDRIRDVFKSMHSLFIECKGILCKDFGYDAKETLNMLDRYLAGEEWNLKNSSHFARMAFAMLIPEVDKAMQRSAAARARAALRRLKAQEQAAAIRSDSEEKSVQAEIAPQKNDSGMSSYPNRSEKSSSHSGQSEDLQRSFKTEKMVYPPRSSQYT